MIKLGSLSKAAIRVVIAGMICAAVAGVSPASGFVLAGGAPPGRHASTAAAGTWTVIVSATGKLRLNHPAGLAIDRRGTGKQKWIYIVDSGNNRIVKVGTGGRVLGGWGTGGSGPGQFQMPVGIAVGPQGDVYVADAGNNRIQEFSPGKRFVRAWGSKGTGPGQFDDPSGVAVGGSGNVFVADRGNRRIEKFSATGQLLATWPVPIPAASQEPSNQVPGPYALTLDGRGNVYVAVDTALCASHCVMDYILLETFSLAGKVTRILAGGDPYGRYTYAPLPGLTGDGPWWQIGALAAGTNGRVYVTDWGPAVVELSASGKSLGRFTLPRVTGGAAPPQGMATGPDGSVYVSDTYDNRILKLTVGR